MASETPHKSVRGFSGKKFYFPHKRDRNGWFSPFPLFAWERKGVMPGATVAMTMRQHRTNPAVIMLLKQSQVLPTSRFPAGRKGATTLAHLPPLFHSVQSLSHVPLFLTPWTAAHQASLSITNSQSLLKHMSIVLVMPSNHLILCRPLLLPPSIFPSSRVFSNESVLCIRWPKYLSEFQLQHQSFQ